MLKILKVLWFAMTLYKLGPRFCIGKKQTVTCAFVTGGAIFFGM